MNYKKGFKLSLVILCVSLIASANVNAVDLDSPQMKALYEKAKKEGEMVMSSQAPGIEKLFQGFMKRYPGVKAVQIPRTSGKTITRFLAERAAGRAPDFDVSYATFTTISAVKGDLIMKPNWVDCGVPAPMVYSRDPYNGKLLYWFDMVYVISYNTNLVKPEDLPRTWEEAVDPKWAGNIAIDPRGHGIGMYVFMTSMEEARNIAKKIVKIKPVFVRTSGGMMSKTVITGEAAIGFAEQLNRVMNNKSKGAPIDWVKTPMIPANPWWIWIPEGIAHINAAKLFTSWVVSEEGMSLYYKVSSRGPVVAESKSELAKMVKNLGIKVAYELNFEEYKKNAKFRKEVMKIFGAMK